MVSRGQLGLLKRFQNEIMNGFGQIARFQLLFPGIMKHANTCTSHKYFSNNSAAISTVINVMNRTLRDVELALS